MADSRISALTELSAAPAVGDLLVIIDVSDSTDHAAGTDKKITVANLLANAQPLDGELTAIAGLTSVADRLPYFTGSGTAALATFTLFGRSLVDDADATAGRSTLGVVIGTDVQAYDADLAAVAGLLTTGLIARTGAGTASVRTITGTANEISVSNGDGVSGNPTLSLPAVVDLNLKVFVLPTGTAPTVDANGEIALDTSITDMSHGLLKYYSGEEVAVIAVPVAELTGMANGDVVKYNSTNDEFEIGAASAGGTPRFTLNFAFEALGKYTASNTGTGANAITATAPGGCQNTTGATDGSKASMYSSSSPAEAIYADSPELQAYAVMSSDVSTAFVSWILIDGDNTPPDSSGVMTGRHIGFILDTTVLYASNANDTTQTRTDVSAGITMTQDNIFRAVQSGSTNIKFYINKTLVATHTTNMKTTGSTNTLVYWGIDNDTGVTTNRNQIVSSMNVLFNAE